MSLSSPKPVVPRHAAQRLQRRLCRHIGTLSPGKPDVSVHLTDNCSTMLSVRREPGRYRLRLHHMFVSASAQVVAALGRYVIHPEAEASATLDAFIAEQSQHLQPVVRRVLRNPRVIERPDGEHHDLRAIFDELNAGYFGGSIDAKITWGRRKRTSEPARLHKSLTMGSYSVEDRLIRIHPTLDRPDVPGYYVAWIVYHEMLHQKHGIPERGGRRQFHPPAFVAEERLFDEYERAHRFEREHPHRLLLY
ncbi:MAG TPA: hypothetical protein PK493_07950 [Pseudomonadota bacterium]|nr:hypothetical protein [Pseudomonadota bacterium]